jgi:DNA-directed RNA polymerase beta' subunit
MQHGMSIGIGDTVADVVTGAKIGEIIDKAKEEVKRIIEAYQVGMQTQDQQCSSKSGICVRVQTGKLVGMRYSRYCC